MFEPGNKLAERSKQFERTVKRALAQEDGKRLRDCAEKLLDLAASGERWAVECLRDTLDGKPTQQVNLGDSEGKPLAIALVAYGPPDTLQLPAPALSITDTESTGQRH